MLNRTPAANPASLAVNAAQCANLDTSGTPQPVKVLLTAEQAKIARDLSDCQQALTSWYERGWADAREDDLHHAIEALLRAVSTLARTVEHDGGAA